ncbi:hypothetical protein GPALN_006022 [Globodera pallida]|nr:hypothetical protein GPALN_006022 [Globodera pallida]
MKIFGFLAFCLVGTLFAGFKCFDALENKPFDVPGKNVLLKQNSRHNKLSKIKVVSGDITKQKVSVIVTDANGQLRHGGGINYAIHRACEPEMDMLQLELDTLIISKESDYTPGSVVVTDAFGNLRKNVQYGAYMEMTRNIPHVQLNSFTVQQRTPEGAVVQRAVENPIVIWFDGIEHYQSIIFDPIAPNASAGSENIFAKKERKVNDMAINRTHPLQSLEETSREL